MIKSIIKNEKEQQLIDEYYKGIDIDTTRKELLTDYNIKNEDLDFSFDERDLIFKYQENTRLFYLYNDIYQKENTILAQLQDNYKKLQGIKYDQYKFNNERDLKKTEIEQYYLPQDEDLLTMKELIKKQEIRVHFIELICKTFEKQNWNMKSFKDILYK
jgi:hypothetical protein